MEGDHQVTVRLASRHPPLFRHCLQGLVVGWISYSVGGYFHWLRINNDVGDWWGSNTCLDDRIRALELLGYYTILYHDDPGIPTSNT